MELALRGEPAAPTPTEYMKLGAPLAGEPLQLGLAQEHLTGPFRQSLRSSLVLYSQMRTQGCAAGSRASAVLLQLFCPHLLPPLLVLGGPAPSPQPAPTLTVFELVHLLSQRPEVGVIQGCLC